MSYELLKIEVILFEMEDIITESLGDNEVPEIGEGSEGGIFG